MSHDGDCLPRRDFQVEVCQHRLAIIVTEKDFLELNFAVQPPPNPHDRLLIQLAYTRFGVDEGEDALAGRQPKLELAPERRNAGDGEPQYANALQEEEPVSRRDPVIQRVQPAEVDDDDGTNIVDQHQQGEYSIIDETRSNIDMVRLLVDSLE